MPLTNKIANNTFSKVRMDILQAAKDGNLLRVKQLLEEGVDVNAKNGFGWTALMVAAWNGHVEVVHALVGAGADLNAKDNDGWTALMGTAENGHVEVVRALLAAGADVNAKKNDGSRRWVMRRCTVVWRWCARCWART